MLNPIPAWLHHLLQNPSARDNFLAHLEKKRDVCYKRALDDIEADIAALVGEKNAYANLISAVRQAMADPQKEIDEITAYLFPRNEGQY